MDFLAHPPCPLRKYLKYFFHFCAQHPLNNRFINLPLNNVWRIFFASLTGFLVVICLEFLMPYTAFIPKATLAAVIISAVIFSVEHQVLKPIWNSYSKLHTSDFCIQNLWVLSISSLLNYKFTLYFRNRFAARSYLFLSMSFLPAWDGNRIW